MKTIGLLGGMSYESTISYYKIINNTVNKELGRLHSAKCILYSVDFEEIEWCQSTGDWDESAYILSHAAIALERAGVDFIVICTNTMHKVADKIQEKVKIPLLHITVPTIEKLKKKNIKKVGLLGTKYTMEQDFYKFKLISAGIEVLVPSEEEIEKVNSIIYNELCLGKILSDSKKEFLRIMEELNNRGAEGIILGCTEIGLLIQKEDTKIPLFDTTIIHAESAALYSIEKESELCLGKILSDSKKEFLRIMEELNNRGAEGIILGCTEIGLLIQKEDTKIPLFDTTIIHAESAALYSIEKESRFNL